MKTITITGNPESLTAIMVAKAEVYKEHDAVKIASSDHDQSVIKTIFRIVDAGEGQWELQFE